MARTYKSFAQSYICKTHCERLGYLEGSIKKLYPKALPKSL